VIVELAISARLRWAREPVPTTVERED
jgi:hypothetical protein